MSNDAKVGLGCVQGIFSVASGIIFYVLLHMILNHINATDVMWTLYWIYLPIAILILCVGAVVRNVLSNA
jgi:hypothetical protein